MISLIGFVMVQCVFCIVQAGQQDSGRNTLWNSTWVDTLKRDLLVTYEKFTRPHEKNSTTNVEFVLSVVNTDIDERKSQFIVHGWTKMLWNDNKLKWNDSDYGDLVNIHFAVHEIWQPDITLYNNAAPTSAEYGFTNLIVFSNGQVLWVPPSTFYAFCKIDLYEWPSDLQKCKLVFGSWTYNGYEIDINTTEIDTSHYIKNNEWTIVNSTVSRESKYYNCCTEPYTSLTFEFYLQRETSMLSSTIVIPASVIILMILSNFWLPSQSGEKILLNCVIAILIIILLLYFASRIPFVTVNTPKIIKFYSCSLCLISFSLIISVIVLNISRMKTSKPLPWPIKSFFNGIVGKILLLQSYGTQPKINQQRPEELREQQFSDEHTTSDDHHIIQTIGHVEPLQRDWVMLATAIDRLVFFIYCLIYICLAIKYSV